MTEFTSYEKNIESTITTIRHTVRIRLNSDRALIEDVLKNVPYNNAKVSMIVDDSELEGYGEIHFLEEK